MMSGGVHSARQRLKERHAMYLELAVARADASQDAVKYRDLGHGSGHKAADLEGGDLVSCSAVSPFRRSARLKEKSIIIRNRASPFQSTHLRHEHGDANLANVGGLTAHVRARDDLKL